MIQTLASRLLKRIKQGSRDECWLFVGSKTDKGYGKIGNGKPEGGWLLAHRVAYESFVGPIPAGMRVLHHCDNPPCCNWVSHLYVGTSKDNAIDREKRGRRVPAHGETHVRAKLTEKDVATIRASRELGKTLARKYGVAISTIQRARKRVSWKRFQEKPDSVQPSSGQGRKTR